MTIALAGEYPAKLDVGRVVSQSFAVFGRHWAAMLGFTVLFSGLPTAALDGLVAMADPANAQTYLSRFSTVGSTIGGVIGLLAQAAIMHMAVRDVAGEPVSPGESLRAGANAFGGLFVLNLALNLGVVLGLLLLVVPGLYLAVIWSVLLPVYLMERLKMSACFERSDFLVRGNRWRVAGLFLIMAVLVLAGLLFTGLATLGLTFVGVSADGVAAQLLINGVASSIAILAFGVGSGVLYAELRRLREGRVAGHSLAEVFS